MAVGTKSMVPQAMMSMPGRNYQAAAMAVGTVPQPTVRKQAAGDAIRANQPKCKNENRRKRGPSNGH